MRYIKRLLFTLLAFISLSLQAQILDPVKWQFKVVQKPGSATAELHLIATIDDGWHLYSQNLADDGPIPTTFNFKTDNRYKTLGKTLEPKAITEFDPNFNMELAYFSKKATFVQKVEILSEKDFQVVGELEFMVCDDKQCLPPKYVDFAFQVSGAKPSILPSYGSEEESLIPPTEPNETIPPVDSPTTASNPIVTSESQDSSPTFVPKEIATAAGSSLWTIFLLGFGGGLLALLMPCIFPMIPLTVSFFTKQSKTKADGIKKAAIYGFSIVAIYVLLGLMVTLITGDSSALNALSTNPWFNLLFFALFVVFAISFFGAFEITLPSSWVNKADEASNKGGLAGIFFMAFTLSLVSFSCTGPIIGSLLVDAASRGEYLGPAMGMLGFSLALAIPFALFAAFPAWLNSLPKSGGWLNTVKVSLGFIELAFALKFLSTADMAWQAGWLKRELFLALWIGIFLLLTLYLLGRFKMPHDSPGDKISVSRLLFAVLFGSFTIYLLPGMWGAPLHLISGFPPPQFYSESPSGLSGAHAPTAESQTGVLADGANPEHCPHALNCFHDFEQGLAYAIKVNKPIMLDFTGWGCVNCRKMEEQVWSDPRVLRRLQNDVVLISLYVDERVKLPENEQRYSEILKTKIKTIGNKWSEFQAIHYQNNSQPYYVIIDHNSMKPLIPPTAYNPDIEYYINWLDAGIKAFQNK